MDSYNVVWKRSATKEARKLSKSILLRILQAVENLSTDPYPIGSRKIMGAANKYRIRVGDYRVIYSVDDDILLIEIVRVRHRKDVYKQL